MFLPVIDFYYPNKYKNILNLVFFLQKNKISQICKIVFSYLCLIICTGLLACAQIFVKMTVKNASGSQKHETLYDKKIIKTKYPDLFIITNQKEVHFINGHDVLYLLAGRNYTYVKSIDRDLIKVTKPMKEVSPLFENYLVCISCGLSLNLNRMDTLEKKEKNCKIVFVDSSILILKQKEGKTLCKLLRDFNK